jgi:RNA polymerase sigma-70 factor (ECF subfamily)
MFPKGKNQGGQAMFPQTHAVYRPNHAGVQTDRSVSVRTYANTAEIEAFVTKHENRIFRTAFAIMGNKADAEDIMQEIFLKVIEAQNAKPFRFESDEHEEAWLTRVTVNQCKTMLRSHKWRKAVPLEDITETSTGIDGNTNTEKTVLIESINALPPKQRIAVYLFYYENYSTKEISELTKQNESTVRSHLARARKKLKELILDSDIDGIYGKEEHS